MRKGVNLGLVIVIYLRNGVASSSLFSRRSFWFLPNRYPVFLPVRHDCLVASMKKVAKHLVPTAIALGGSAFPKPPRRATLD